MRPAPLAIAISVALHAAAVAGYQLHDAKPPELRLVSPAPADVAPEPEPVAIVLLPDHAPALAVAPRIRDSRPASHGTSRAPATSTAAISSVHGDRQPEAHGTEPAGSAAAPPPEGGFTEGLSTDFVDHFLANSKPLEHEPAPTGELHPNGREMKSNHDTFDAHVGRDGYVTMDTKPDVDVHPGCLFGGCKMAFDDALMRRHGIDPYASAKRQWLDKTRDERVAMGIAFKKEELAHSAIYMQKNLEWMWQHTGDPAERKHALFELWDEAAETGEDELVQGGAAARAYLIGFVRSRLPAGSPEAFSEQELAELNAHRTSHATFAPYAP